MKTFDYQNRSQYEKSQKGRHKLKKDKKKPLSYYQNHLKFFLSYIPNKNDIKSIICHGVRNDNEIDCFKKIFPGAEVFGTDINYENKNKNIFKYDFSKLPEEWNRKFNLVYSNAIDHCFDIDETLKEWKRVGTKYMVIIFSGGEPTETDPFRVEEKDIKELCEKHNLKILNLCDFVLTAKF